MGRARLLDALIQATRGRGRPREVPTLSHWFQNAYWDPVVEQNAANRLPAPNCNLVKTTVDSVCGVASYFWGLGPGNPV